MRATAHKMVLLGDLVVATFDIAARYSSDPRVVSLVASEMVMHVLRRAGKGTGSGQAHRMLRRPTLGPLPAFAGGGLGLGPLTPARG